MNFAAPDVARSNRSQGVAEFRESSSFGKTWPSYRIDTRAARSENRAVYDLCFNGCESLSVVKFDERPRTT